MKALITAVQVILSFILITIGCNYVSKPSDFYLVIGVISVVVGIALLYRPFTKFIKQL